MLGLVDLMLSTSFVSYLGSISMSKLIKSIKNLSGEYDRFTEFCVCMCVCGPCGALELDKLCIKDISLTSHHASDDTGERVMRHKSEAPVMVTAPWCKLSMVMCTLVNTLSLCVNACVKGVSYGVQAQCALSV